MIAPRAWLAAFCACAALVALGLLSAVYVLVRGPGVWGLNVPVFWGWDIVGLLFWLGLAHAGVMLSAVMRLMRRTWGHGVKRLAEALTLCALPCAVLYPLIHLGRPWLAYYLLPYPNYMQVWPNFQSALVWDAVGIAGFGLVALLFCYFSWLPKLAALRDRTGARWWSLLLRLAAVGWRASAATQLRRAKALHFLAVLVLGAGLFGTVIASADFAYPHLSVWTRAVLPVEMLAGSVLSGAAALVLLTLCARRWSGPADEVPGPSAIVHGPASVGGCQVSGSGHQEAGATPRPALPPTLYPLPSVGRLAQLAALGGLVLALVRLAEAAGLWFGGDPAGRFVLADRLAGPFAWATWGLTVCGLVAPQLLWLRGLRARPSALMVLSLLALAGVWLDRFLVVVVAVHRDALPSGWGSFQPTWADVLLFAGTVGAFGLLMLVWARAANVGLGYRVSGLGERRAMPGGSPERAGPLPPTTNHQPPTVVRVPMRIATTAAVVVALLLPAGLAAIIAARHLPHPFNRPHIFGEIVYQPKHRPQSESQVFEDRRPARTPPPGTVAWGELEADGTHFRGLVRDEHGDEKPVATIPIPVTEELKARGRERYAVYCGACHGASGTGDGPVALRAARLKEGTWSPPVALSDRRVVAMPDGELYRIVCDGTPSPRRMPGLAALIPVRDRWAIVARVRELQRGSANGRE